MAYYSTEDDLKNYVPESQLIEITDDNNLGQIDEDKLTDALRRAQNYIDSFLRGRYDLPLTTIPESIRDLSIKLSAYFLFKRSLLVTLPEPVKEDYEDATTYLKEIQKGKVNPFPLQDEPVFFKSNKTAADRVFVSGQPLTTGTPGQGQNSWSAYPI